MEGLLSPGPTSSSLWWYMRFYMALTVFFYSSILCSYSIVLCFTWWCLLFLYNMLNILTKHYMLSKNQISIFYLLRTRAIQKFTRKRITQLMNESQPCLNSIPGLRPGLQFTVLYNLNGEQTWKNTQASKQCLCNFFLAWVYIFKIVCCFVAKVSYVAILRFLCNTYGFFIWKFLNFYF